MSIKTVFLLLSVCFFLFSCQNEESAERPISFEKSIITSELETIKIPPVLFKERMLICTDDFLVSNSATEDTLIRVFDLANMNYLGGFGKVGQGPSEYEHFVTSSFYSPKGNVIQASSIKYNRLIDLSVNEEKGLSKNMIDQFDTPKELLPFNHLYQLNDTAYVGAKPFDKEGEVWCFSLQSGKGGSLIPYPDFEPAVNGLGKSMLYQKQLRMSRDRSKIVISYYHYPLLRIYDTAHGETKNVFIEVDPSFYIPENVQMRPDGRNITNEKFYAYFTYLHVTNKYIYALMHVRDVFDRSTRTRKSLSAQEVFILDLEGNPVLKIVLKDWMHLFTPTVDDEYLYFWHPEVENELYRLPIGKYLN